MITRKPEDISENQDTIKYLDNHLKKGLFQDADQDSLSYHAF